MGEGDLQVDMADSPETIENGVENDEEQLNFSDPEDYVDDIPDEELMSDLYRRKPREHEGCDSVIVVDNIPQVGKDRFDKLKTVLSKLFGKYGRIVSEYFPVDEDGKTKGFLFIEYEREEQAVEAVRAKDGHPLDKQHIFRVNLFRDIEKYSSISEEWTPPEPAPYVDRGNLKSWLMEADCYDQYAVLYEAGEMAGVYWNANPQPILVKERRLWTENNIVWSPLGTYLSTFHKRGIAIWGGEEFQQIARFTHDNVSCIDFSPRERFLVTLSAKLAAEDDPNAVIIWDTRTGAKKRTFNADQGVSSINWPIFKWSHDDCYVARMTADTLSVYETGTMMLLDKKSLKIPGIRNFSWSPSRNVLVYWVAEDKDVPARVSLIEIPSKVELRAKNLFNVVDCRMHWQKAGDYLCVKVDRYTKATRKDKEVKYGGLYSNFEIFNMKEKQIPVDSIELKERIHAFAWEPVGSKFAIIHGDGPQLLSVSFYRIKQGTTVTLLKKLENKQCNHLFWSPAGQYIVLAGLRNTNHSLLFVDTSDFTILNADEHFMATDVEWDPTGRFLVTGVSYWAHKVDNAFWVWSFTGRLIRKITLDRFCAWLWRPRPPCLLNEEKIKDIKKNLKKYSAEFEIKDRMVLSKVSKEILEKRQTLMAEFRTYREKKCEEFEAAKERLAELRDIDQLTAADEMEEEEEEFEFFIKEEEQLIDDEDEE